MDKTPAKVDKIAVLSTSLLATGWPALASTERFFGPVNGTIFWPDIVESTPMVLANMQKAHVASVMSVHVLAPR